ncbi:hypothetical protein KI387_024792, partial [Taxus chinensis]
ENAIWVVMTVVVVFEFTAGATLSKGLNRCFASLVAGVAGIWCRLPCTTCREKWRTNLNKCLCFRL